jgi:hypothetical protein
MSCDDYKKLMALHKAAKYRVRLYADPEGEPKLRRLNAPVLAAKLDRAVSEEADLRRQIEAHIEFCQLCRDDIHNG